MSEIKKRYQGMWAHRYRQNPLERRFAKAWQDLEQRGRGMLAYMLDETNRGIADVSERDELVAATVIQWIATPVGQSWLAEQLMSKEGAEFRRRFGEELTNSIKSTKGVFRGGE